MFSFAVSDPSGQTSIQTEFLQPWIRLGQSQLSSLRITPGLSQVKRNIWTYILVQSPTCYIDRDYISCYGLGLLPHPLLRCRKPGDRLHVHIDGRLIGGGQDIPTGGGVDGVEDQWGQRSHVVQDEPLVFI